MHTHMKHENFQISLLLRSWIHVSCLLQHPIHIWIRVWENDACWANYNMCMKRRMRATRPCDMCISMRMSKKVFSSLLDLIRVMKCVCELFLQMICIWACILCSCSLCVCVSVLVWSLIWLLFSLSPKYVQYI